MGEDHYGPSLRLRGGFEDVGIGVDGYRGELEELGEQSSDPVSNDTLFLVLVDLAHENMLANALFAPRNRAYAAMYSLCGFGIHLTAFCSLSCLHG